MRPAAIWLLMMCKRRTAGYWKAPGSWLGRVNSTRECGKEYCLAIGKGNQLCSWMLLDCWTYIDRQSGKHTFLWVLSHFETVPSHALFTVKNIHMLDRPLFLVRAQPFGSIPLQLSANPLPSYPGLHAHEKEPRGVFVQFPFSVSQLWVPAWHSSISIVNKSNMTHHYLFARKSGNYISQWWAESYQRDNHNKMTDTAVCILGQTTPG